MNINTCHEYINRYRLIIRQYLITIIYSRKLLSLSRYCEGLGRPYIVFSFRKPLLFEKVMFYWQIVYFKWFDETTRFVGCHTFQGDTLSIQIDQ